MSSTKVSKELKDTYELYKKHGDAKATEMSGKNFVKCCKECGVIGSKCTSTDADIVFSKVIKKGTRTMNVNQFHDGLVELGKKLYKGGDETQAVKLVEGKKPGNTGVTKQSKTGGVDKMTDTSQYTGAHKQRFGEDGKGKGIEGRVDKVDNKGYVGNYKGEGSYNEKVGK